MNPATRLSGRIGPHALLITTAAVPLTGWAVHAVALHKRLAATKRDPLTGLLRRDAYTTRARRLLARHGDNTAVIMIDADRFKQINDGLGHAAGDAVLAAFGFPVKSMCSALLLHWRLLRKLRCSTNRITGLVKAVLVLH